MQPARSRAEAETAKNGALRRARRGWKIVDRGSADLLGGGLEVVGGRINEPDRPAGATEQLDAVGVLLGEDLDDRALGAGREALDLAAQSRAVVELVRRRYATDAARST
jgi:hypothetical protein